MLPGDQTMHRQLSELDVLLRYPQTSVQFRLEKIGFVCRKNRANAEDRSRWRQEGSVRRDGAEMAAI